MPNWYTRLRIWYKWIDLGAPNHKKQSLKYKLKIEINDFQWANNEKYGEGHPHEQHFIAKRNGGNNTFKFKK